MLLLIVVVFVIGYMAIALEHPLHVNKAASALLIGAVIWTILALGGADILSISPSFAKALASAGGSLDPSHFVTEELLHHTSEIASILFFLLAAMAVVELIDAHEGFGLITDRINTSSKVKLVWIISVLTFLLSSVLDNLTTAIVMVALLRKLVKSKEDLWLFASMVIIAANAGGAWSPIGDVTTIMLWIGGQVTTPIILSKLIIPSLLCLFVPLIILTFTLKGEFERKLGMVDKEHLEDRTTPFEQKLVLGLGLGTLLYVPAFKSITHLPPFMGLLLGLGVMWVATELMHHSKNETMKRKLSVTGVLQRIDTSSVLFFLGILVAVAGLQTVGHLGLAAQFLESSIGDVYAINVLIGLLSAVIDNVPLVAGAMGMYDLLPAGTAAVAGTGYPVDHTFWVFLAYCAGTGGSCLIIGSAAGVAVMGLLQIDFIWYLKRVTLLATSGYLAGALYYIAIDKLMGA